LRFNAAATKKPYFRHKEDLRFLRKFRGSRRDDKQFLGVAAEHVSFLKKLRYLNQDISAG